MLHYYFDHIRINSDISFSDMYCEGFPSYWHDILFNESVSIELV